MSTATTYHYGALVGAVWASSLKRRERCILTAIISWTQKGQQLCLRSRREIAARATYGFTAVRSSIKLLISKKLIREEMNGAVLRLNLARIIQLREAGQGSLPLSRPPAHRSKPTTSRIQKKKPLVASSPSTAPAPMMQPVLPSAISSPLETSSSPLSLESTPKPRVQKQIPRLQVQQPKTLSPPEVPVVPQCVQEPPLKRCEEAPQRSKNPPDAKKPSLEEWLRAELAQRMRLDPRSKALRDAAEVAAKHYSRKDLEAGLEDLGFKSLRSPAGFPYLMARRRAEARPHFNPARPALRRPQVTPRFVVPDVNAPYREDVIRNALNLFQRGLLSERNALEQGASQAQIDQIKGMRDELQQSPKEIQDDQIRKER